MVVKLWFLGWLFVELKRAVALVGYGDFEIE